MNHVFMKFDGISTLGQSISLQVGGSRVDHIDDNLRLTRGFEALIIVGASVFPVVVSDGAARGLFSGDGARIREATCGIFRCYGIEVERAKCEAEAV